MVKITATRTARLQLAVLAFHALPAVNSVYGDWKCHDRDLISSFIGIKSISAK